jgi:hypothetical protein
MANLQTVDHVDTADDFGFANSFAAHQARLHMCGLNALMQCCLDVAMFKSMVAVVAQQVQQSIAGCKHSLLRRLW